MQAVVAAILFFYALVLLGAFLKIRRDHGVLIQQRQYIEGLDTRRREESEKKRLRAVAEELALKETKEKRAKEAALVLWEEERLDREEKDNELEARRLECRTLIQQLKSEGKKPKKPGKSHSSSYLPLRWIRAYADASIKKGVLGVGVAFKRADGTTFKTVSQPISYSGVEQDMQSKIDFAEGSAVLMAVKYARELNVPGVQVLTDSRNTVKSVNSKKCCDSLAREIRAEAAHLSEGILVEWISRDENTEAHDLANRGRQADFGNGGCSSASEAASVKDSEQPSFQPLREDDLPEIPDSVQWLAACTNPSNRELAAVKVGGRDVFTSMSADRLWKAVRARHGESELGELKRQLHKNRAFTSHTKALLPSGKVALRWSARGLPVDLALRKASLTVHSAQYRRN